MADEHKSVALVILGIVAVIAIIGLVLLFVQGKAATGQGIYGGAIKRVEYPYWVGEGTPRNIPGQESLWPSSASKNAQTNWNWNDGSGDGNPYYDIDSPIKKCGSGGFLIPSSESMPEYYQSLGYAVVLTEGSKGGYACVYPNTPMVGGIAGLI